MADWNEPVISSAYATHLQTLKDRDADGGSLFFSIPTNPPDRLFRFNRSTNIFEEVLSGVWSAKVLAIAGGGTGAVTAAAARTALGLGTIATQDSATVSITGGTVQGILQAKGGNMTFDGDGTRDIGTNAAKANRVYIKNALVIPVGTDKYATS